MVCKVQFCFLHCNNSLLMSLAFDEYGRPFLILREQGQKTRLTGLQAQKASLENDSTCDFS